MGEVANVLGVFGFILSCIALLWQFWTRHDDRKEKVNASVEFGGTVETGPLLTIFVKVWNSGRIPVHLEKVALTCTAQAAVKELRFIEKQNSKGPLGIGEPRYYYLPKAPIETLKVFLEKSKGNIWISFHTPGGEISRYSGGEIKQYLEGMVKISEENKGEN
jgi:hypothetical protein